MSFPVVPAQDWAVEDIQMHAGSASVASREIGASEKSVDDSSEDEEDLDDGNGEILHCMFPGCLKEFSSRWSLTRHTRTHTGERPFRCNVCGKEFVQKCSLKRHEQTHSQDKQWICDFPQCGKRFKLKEYLDVHKRTHVKVETEALPVEDEDQVIQDAADAAGALIDQLRQRLVRMSVRHHEQLFSHQQREFQLTQSLSECALALQEACRVIRQHDPQSVPFFVNETSKKFAHLAHAVDPSFRSMLEGGSGGGGIGGRGP